jgi:predicted unusual protein kinase regulating ubiquinone biosynthesis (AarF/ABC1/UbiB family)
LKSSVVDGSNELPRLVYLDFGLVAQVPLGVREALICSIIHIVDRNFDALAREFDALMLLDTAELTGEHAP